MRPHTFKKIVFLFSLAVALQHLYSQGSRELYKLAKQQYNAGDYAGSLKNRLQGLALAEKNKDCYETGYGHLLVGNMHYYLNNKTAALAAYTKAQRYIDSCGIDTLKTFVYHNIGSLYVEMHKTDSALLFLNKALALLYKTKQYGDVALANAVIAELYLNKNDLKQAQATILKAEKYAALSDNTSAKVLAALKHSGYYMALKNYAQAIRYARLAVALEEKRENAEGRMAAMKTLADRLAIAGNPEAKVIYDRYLDLKDSVFKKETADKIASYKTLYDTEKKESENTLLHQKNLLNLAEIDVKNKTINGLLIGVLLIVIVIAWRISVMNLKKKNLALETAQALQKEKERISRDLHDNVGGQLSYVLFSLEGAEDPLPDKRKEKAENLAMALRQVTGNLRETIWALTNEQLTLNDVSDKLKLYARNIFSFTGVKLKFDEDIKQDEILNPAFALNLFRICQEIIHNAFKHARASELCITLHKKEKINLVISDNGIGFNHAGGQSSGYGLANLKLRALEMGATLTIKSEPAKGTTITLIV